MSLPHSGGDNVMFQLVFATLHQAVLSTGGVKCYALKLYHPPQYMVNMHITKREIHMHPQEL